MSKALDVDLARAKREALDMLETAFNIKYDEASLRRMSTEHRMLMVMLKQSEVINKLIEKNNKLANHVLGPQKPKADTNGIILLNG